MSNFSNQEAARMALLAMYAEDSYASAGGGGQVARAAIDPRVALAGWDVVGLITARDALFVERRLGLGETVFYGFLARSVADTSQYRAVIRGTHGITAWVEDATFAPIDHPLGGKVEQGFYGIYSSMAYVDADGIAVPVAAGVAREVKDNKVTVVGHSLGSALATYFALDLAISRNMGSHVSACLFASPRPGNLEFVNHFDQSVAAYDVFNYGLDLVPTVPGLFGYSSLPKTTKIRPNLEMIRFSPDCNHHALCYAQLLDPAALDLSQIPEIDVRCAACVK